MKHTIPIRILFILCGLFVLAVTIGASLYAGKMFLDEINDLSVYNEYQQDSSEIIKISTNYIYVNQYLSETDKSLRAAELKLAGIVALYDDNKNIVWKNESVNNESLNIISYSNEIQSKRAGKIYIASVPIIIDADTSSLREFADELFSDNNIRTIPDELIGHAVVEKPYKNSLGTDIRDRYLLVGSLILTSMILLLTFIIYRLIGRPIALLKTRISVDNVIAIQNDFNSNKLAVEEFKGLVDAYLQQHNSILQVNETLEDQVIQRTHELGELTEKLRVLAFRATHDNESITKRIAGELHDDLCSIQISLKRKMEIFKKKKSNGDDMQDVEEHLADWINMTDRADTVARNIIGRFRSVVTDYLGLEAGLKDAMMHTVENVENIDSFFINRSSKLEELAPVVHDELVRIVQEAVRNVVKHTKAKRVTVSVDDDNDNIVIRVSDDGGGFDRLSLPHSYGLQIMEERAAYIHGKTEFERTPKGTDVIITVPTNL